MRRFFFALATCAVASVWPAIASADNKEFSQAVAATLRDSGRLSDYQIGVTTKDDVVYLNGRVASQQQGALAVQMASAMPGVSKVVNNLDVKATKKSAGGSRQQNESGGEDGMANARKTIFPDPSVPAKTGGKGLLAKGRSKQPSTAGKKLSPATSQAYAVQQVSQNVPESFTPTESEQMMQAPMMVNGPGMQGPMMLPSPQQMQGPQMQMMQAQMSQQQMMPNAARLAMAPIGAAGAAAGAMMGQCPPGGGPGGMGGGPGGPGGPYGGPQPMGVPAVSGGVAPARYDQPNMPNYAWPSYAAYPNYAAVAYPRQYSPTAWPYIGPFYPYPQVPLGWRKVMLEWDDGWWMLNFKQ
jgi:hypothetical protein